MRPVTPAPGAFATPCRSAIFDLVSDPVPFGSRDPTRRWLRLRDVQAHPTRVLEAARISRPPVPVHQLAMFIGVEVVTRDGTHWTARLVAPDVSTRPRIELASRLSHQERQWWIAHLLGHLIHDPFPIEQVVGGVDGEDPTSRACAVADEWAADLVAPYWLVEPALYSGRVTWEQLANMFDLPVRTMQALVERIRG